MVPRLARAGARAGARRTRHLHGPSSVTTASRADALRSAYLAIGRAAEPEGMRMNPASRAEVVAGVIGLFGVALVASVLASEWPMIRFAFTNLH